MSLPFWPKLPDGLVLDRTTPEFNQGTVPKGLLRNHKVAREVWGNIRVLSGSIEFVFEATAEVPELSRIMAAGDEQAIPPVVLHHLRIVGPVTLVVDFWSQA